MTLENITDRIKHWGDGGCYFKSLYNRKIEPLFKHLDLFHGKVLEIGPGNGRGFITLKDHHSNFDSIEYGIADIQTSHMDNENFIGVKWKFHITDYDIDFEERFDIIHAWYVIHHVSPVEVPDFIRFLHRHLKCGGKLILNYPTEIDDTNGCRFGNNGILTFKHRKHILFSSINTYFTVQQDSNEDIHNDYYIAIKES